MKTICLTGILAAIILSATCQPSAPVFLASVSGEYKMALAKTTIHLTEWHEETFWDQFQSYVDEDVVLANNLYNTMSFIGGASKESLSDESAAAAGDHLIKNQYAQLALWRKYFQEISAAHNGVIALKFLQTEVLLSLLEGAQQYEQTPLTKFRFHPIEDTTTSLPIEKRELLTAALKLSEDQAMPFFKEYMRYEDDCDDLLGYDYSLIAAYADEPSDYTPAQAKIVGNNLLEVVRREIALKEKYYTVIRDTMGGSLAARFLAWEDYYSIVSKMDAWAEAR